jgi:hypothetical protein
VHGTTSHPPPSHANHMISCDALVPALVDHPHGLVQGLLQEFEVVTGLCGCGVEEGILYICDWLSLSNKTDYS